MSIEIPAWLRITLYLIAGIGTPVLALLLYYGVLDQAGLAAWSAVVAAISAVAASHVTSPAVVTVDDGQDGTTEGTEGLPVEDATE